MPDSSRTLSVMEYQPVDRVLELGAGVSAADRGSSEDPETRNLHYQWFPARPAWGWTSRSSSRSAQHDPSFRTGDPGRGRATIITSGTAWDHVRKALKEGTTRGGRMSMDTYIDFPVTDMAGWREIKKRYEMLPRRYEPNWQETRVPAGKPSSIR